MLDDSDVLALLGLKSIEGRNGVIDTRISQRKMYVCENPQDIEIHIRPGARNVHAIQLEQAPSGHLLMPCTAYSKLQPRKKQVTFNTFDPDG